MIGIPVLERRGQAEVTIWELLFVHLLLPTHSVVPEEQMGGLLFGWCLRICLLSCAQPSWERAGEAVGRWAGLGCWYSLDGGLLGYLILLKPSKKKKKKISRKEVPFPPFSSSFSQVLFWLLPLDLGTWRAFSEGTQSQVCFLCWKGKENCWQPGS